MKNYSIRMRKKRIIIFTLATVVTLATIVLSHLPVVGHVGRVLLLFSTLAHELGHALMALITGMDVKRLEIAWDGSGVVMYHGNPARLTRGLIAAAGLVGPAMGAAALFWSARGNDARLLIGSRLFGLALVLAGVLVARSFWALLFTVGLGLLLLILATRISRFSLETLVVFIGIQLGASVFTRADYLFTRYAGPGSPSDVAQMADALFLPYWFWGALCGLFSVVVLLWGCRCYIKD